MEVFRSVILLFLIQYVGLLPSWKSSAVSGGAALIGLALSLVRGTGRVSCGNLQRLLCCRQSSCRLDLLETGRKTDVSGKQGSETDKKSSLAAAKKSTRERNSRIAVEKNRPESAAVHAYWCYRKSIASGWNSRYV